MVSGQSVLLQDEAKHNGQAGGDVAINMDDFDKSRFQQQLQLIDEQVSCGENTLKFLVCFKLMVSAVSLKSQLCIVS